MARICTEVPTPTASKNEGRIWVGTLIDVPLRAMMLMVESRERITTIMGSTTPEIRLNMMKRQMPTATAARPRNRRMSVIMDCFR